MFIGRYRWGYMKNPKLILHIMSSAFLAAFLVAAAICVTRSDEEPGGSHSFSEASTRVPVQAPTAPAFTTIPELQWRTARQQRVVWVEREFAHEETINLPNSLPHGSRIETEGPANASSPLGCRAIFIIREPPWEIQGRNMEIWKGTAVRIPGQIDGEHVWKFRTANCKPWRGVESVRDTGQEPVFRSSSMLAVVEDGFRTQFPEHDIICEGEMINDKDMVVCEVSDSNQFMFMLGVYNDATGSTLESYSSNYIYEGGAMTICQWTDSRGRTCQTVLGVGMNDFIRTVGLQRQTTAERLSR